MNLPEFEAGLKAKHYGEITTVDGAARNYAVGDIFRIPAGIVHLESAGPSGVRYRVGRKMVAAT